MSEKTGKLQGGRSSGFTSHVSVTLLGVRLRTRAWWHPAYWTAAVRPSSREAESTGVGAWGWEANRDTLGSFAGSVLMRSKPEEQVATGPAIAPGERESDAPAGDEEGESLKDKLVAQKSRVPPEEGVLVTTALPGLLRAGEGGEEMTPSGGWGCRSKQEEAEPAHSSKRSAPQNHK